MQRKIPNINFRNLLSSSSGVDKLKLHSIPINKMKNVKSNVLYSIPGIKHCAHFCGIYKLDNKPNHNSANVVDKTKTRVMPNSNPTHSGYNYDKTTSPYDFARDVSLSPVVTGFHRRAIFCLRRSIKKASFLYIHYPQQFAHCMRRCRWQLGVISDKETSFFIARFLQQFARKLRTPFAKHMGVVTSILLSVGFLSLLSSPSCSAWVIAGTGSDSGTISELPGGTSAPATASLSLSNANMVSNATTPGDIATVSTDVTVSVANAESYTLTLKVDNATMNVGNTTISAGNVVSDNTWGYKWDNASSYTAPSTSGQTLVVPALSNNSTNFTKTLTFGAKFAGNAEAGHYKASGTLSLVATPKTTTYTLADLTQMQQLTLAPEACTNTPYLSGQTYSAEYKLTDVRDGNTYTVRKFGDGKCWMTQNLKLSNIVGSDSFGNGRKLIPSTSDIDTEWTLPASSTSGFSDSTASNAYVSGSTGYYTWCATTAGTCSSATSDGANATNSICPKGWKLPTGGTSGNTDFYNLFKNMGLTISSSLATSGNTSWGTGDLAIAQGSPYNFAYTGSMYDSSTSNLSGQYGCWWSRTASSSAYAYYLSIYSSYVYPGTGTSGRYHGSAVRCVAQ